MQALEVNTGLSVKDLTVVNGQSIEVKTPTTMLGDVFVKSHGVAACAAPSYSTL